MALDDAERAGAVLESTVGDASERTAATLTTVQLLVNRGRLEQAVALLKSAALFPPPLLQVYLLGGGLDYDPGGRLGADGTTTLTEYAAAPVSPSVGERTIQYTALCSLERWRLARGDIRGAPEAIARLRRLASEPDRTRRTVIPAGLPVICPTMLEATLAVVEPGRNPAAQIARLDSVMRSGPLGAPDGLIGNLVVARLFERRGQYGAALAAIRRRSRHWKVSALWNLPAYLRLEGRLAARTGDRAGAARAYRQYLALLAAPGPAFAPQVDSVRAELAEVLRSSK